MCLAGSFAKRLLLCLSFLGFLSQFVIRQGSQHGAVQLHSGRQSSLVTSVFLMIKASSTVFTFTRSVADELEAIAEPVKRFQPGTQNLPLFINLNL